MGIYTVDRRGFLRQLAIAGLGATGLSREATANRTGPGQPPGNVTPIVLESGTVITVSDSGSYAVSAPGGHWTFGGALPVRPTNLTITQGMDALGDFVEATFHYRTSIPRSSWIRGYHDKAIVLFHTLYPNGGANADRFPRFQTSPQNVFRFTYNGSWTSPFNWLPSRCSPYTYFDAQGNTCILSAAANYVNSVRIANPDGSFELGIDPQIPSLPSDFAHLSILTFSSGINDAFDLWGRAITDLHGKNRPANDSAVLLNKLSYWTDAYSAYYYYSNDPTQYVPALRAVKAAYAQQGVPIASMELDSWYYPKGSPTSWKSNGSGMDTYEPDPALFPAGLANFQEDIGLPLTTHARWIDASSDIRNNYQMSGNICIDPSFWTQYGQYLQSAGVDVLEQDWLSENAQPAVNIGDADAFFGNMSKGMAKHGRKIMYCMPLPQHYLQSAKHDNVIAIRVSSDGFNRGRWDSFLYDSRLASAVGLWPFTDAASSANARDLVMATLSAGPVGVGDAAGAVNVPNLKQVIRPDSVIVKPDVSIVPLDRVYITDAMQQVAPMIAAAYTFHANGRAAYVMAYDRTTGAQSGVTLSPAEIGIPGAAYVYNYFTGVGQPIADQGVFTDTVDSNGSYYIAVPIGPSGIAFLGDAGKFAALGRKRIAGVTDNGVLQASLLFAPGETSVTVQGYAPKAPAVTSTSGAVVQSSYAASGIFQIVASPGADGTAAIQLHL